MTTPERLTLEGTAVRLERLRPGHVEALTALALAHVDAYRLTSTPATTDQAEHYFARALSENEAGTARVMVALSPADGRLLGSTRLTDIVEQHRRCELGYTWFRPDAFGGPVNVDSKRLLLRHAFEDLGLHRVQIHTDSRNLRSQHAIRALGARFEGVLRRHMVAKDGVVRDTVVFAITDEDWPFVSRHLEARLARKLSRAA